MKPFITLLFFISSILSIAQTPDVHFQKSYGGSSFEMGKAMVSLYAGELVFCAESMSDQSGDKGTNSYGGSDYWIVKTNIQGDVIWETSIGGNQSDYPSDICKTTDGGFLIVGNSESGASGNKSSINYGAYDVWLVKLDANGSIVWDKSYGGSSFDFGEKVTPLSNGNFLLGCTSESGKSGNKTENTMGGSDYWCIEIDGLGNIVKQFVVGGIGSDGLRDIIQMGDSKYLLTGSSNSEISGDKLEMSYGGFDYWLVITDTNGAVLHSSTQGGNDQDQSVNSVLGTNKAVFVFGNSGSVPSGSKTDTAYGYNDVWVVALDSNLNKINDYSYGGEWGDAGFPGKLGVYSELTDEFVIAASSSSGVSGNKGVPSFNTSFGDDIWVIGMDAFGNINFELAIGGEDGDQALGIINSESLSVGIIGVSNSGISGNKTDLTNGTTDAWLLDLALMVSVEKVQNQNELNAYPIPTQTVLNFSVPFMVEKSTVTLTSLTGKLVFTEQIGMIKDHQIDVSNLPAGMYVLTVNSDEFSYTRKVVIE